MSSRISPKHIRTIVESIIFGGISYVIIYFYELKNESLAFAVLIFGIYLIASGRISEFKFLGFEAKMKDAENKPLGELTKEISMKSVDFSQDIKQGVRALELKIVPKLIREANKLKILKIVEKKDRNKKYYNPLAMYHYAKYFSHLVFVDKNEIFYGFLDAHTAMREIEKDIPEQYQGSLEGEWVDAVVEDKLEVKFVDMINQWELKEPIIIEYIVMGATRKQVLDKMDKIGLDVLPVVSSGLKYEGFIDRDTVISQITEELMLRQHAKKGQ